MMEERKLSLNKRLAFMSFAIKSHPNVLQYYSYIIIFLSNIQMAAGCFYPTFTKLWKTEKSNNYLNELVCFLIQFSSSSPSKGQICLSIMFQFICMLSSILIFLNKLFCNKRHEYKLNLWYQHYYLIQYLIACLFLPCTTMRLPQVIAEGYETFYILIALANLGINIFLVYVLGTVLNVIYTITSPSVCKWTEGSPFVSTSIDVVFFFLISFLNFSGKIAGTAIQVIIGLILIFDFIFLYSFSPYISHEMNKIHTIFKWVHITIFISVVLQKSTNEMVAHYFFISATMITFIIYVSIRFFNNRLFLKYLLILEEKDYEKLPIDKPMILAARLGSNFYRLPRQYIANLFGILIDLNEHPGIIDFIIQVSYSLNIEFTQKYEDVLSKKRRNYLISKLRYECFMMICSDKSNFEKQFTEYCFEYKISLKNFWTSVSIGNSNLYKLSCTVYEKYSKIRNLYRVLGNKISQETPEFLVRTIWGKNEISCSQVFSFNLFKLETYEKSEDYYHIARSQVKGYYIGEKISMLILPIILCILILAAVVAFTSISNNVYENTFEFYIAESRLISFLSNLLFIGQWKPIYTNESISAEDMLCRLTESELFISNLKDIEQDYQNSINHLSHYKEVFFKYIETLNLQKMKEELFNTQIELVIASASNVSQTTIPIFFSFAPYYYSDFLNGSDKYGIEWYGSKRQMITLQASDTVYEKMRILMNNLTEQLLTELPDMSNRATQNSYIVLYVSTAVIITNIIITLIISNKRLINFFKAFLDIPRTAVKEIIGRLGNESQIESVALYNQTTSQSVSYILYFCTILLGYVITIVFSTILIYNNENKLRYLKVEFNLISRLAKAGPSLIRVGQFITNIMTMQLVNAEFQDDKYREERVQEMITISDFLLDFADFLLKTDLSAPAGSKMYPDDSSFSFTNMVTIFANDIQKFTRAYLDPNQTISIMEYTGIAGNYFSVTPWAYNLLEEITGPAINSLAEMNEKRTMLVYLCILLIAIQFVIYQRLIDYNPEMRTLIDAIGPSIVDPRCLARTETGIDTGVGNAIAVQKFFKGNDLFEILNEWVVISGDDFEIEEISRGALDLFNPYTQKSSYKGDNIISLINRLGGINLSTRESHSFVAEFYLDKKLMRAKFWLTPRGSVCSLEDITALNEMNILLHARTNFIRMIICQKLPVALAAKSLDGEEMSRRFIPKGTVATVMLIGYSGLTLDEMAEVKSLLTGVLAEFPSAKESLTSTQLFSVLFEEADSASGCLAAISFCRKVLEAVKPFKARQLNAFTCVDLATSIYEDVAGQSPFYATYSQAALNGIRIVSRVSPWHVFLSREAYEAVYGRGLSISFENEFTRAGIKYTVHRVD